MNTFTHAFSFRFLSIIHRLLVFPWLLHLDLLEPVRNFCFQQCEDYIDFFGSLDVFLTFSVLLSSIIFLHILNTSR